MSRILWDTSALIKTYVRESDSEYFVDLISRPGDDIWISWITGVEIRCALNQKERLGHLARADVVRAERRFMKDCSDGRLLPLPCDDHIASLARKVLEVAGSGRKHLMVRSLDAIQVATALSARADAIVTTDRRMREVAAMMELKLIPAHQAREVPAGTS